MHTEWMSLPKLLIKILNRISPRSEPWAMRFLLLAVNDVLISMPGYNHSTTYLIIRQIFDTALNLHFSQLSVSMRISQRFYPALSWNPDIFCPQHLPFLLSLPDASLILHEVILNIQIILISLVSLWIQQHTFLHFNYILPINCLMYL